MTTEQQIQALVTLVTDAGAVQVLTGCIDMPEHGAWLSVLEVDADVAPAKGTSAKILVASQEPGEGSTQDPVAPVEFVCTVLWSAPWQGRSKLWLTGGKGGLRKQVERRNYVAGPVPIPLFDLITDICTESGEVLDESVTEESLAPYTFGKWHRPQCTGLAALDKLCAEHALVWRFTPAGKIIVLPLAYPEDPQQPYVSDPGDDGADRCFVVAPDKATLLPATTLLNRQINRLVYDFFEDGLRATCHYGSNDIDDFEAATRAVLPEIPFLPSYMATVVQQRPNKMLEVICDDARIGPLDNVVLFSGVPRSALRAQQGQRVAILFASGDPKLYYAHGFEMDSAATAGVGRVGDSVFCGSIAGSTPPGGGPVTFVITAPDGTVSATDIRGAITSGSADLKLAPGA